MALQNRQPKWNIYESVILLDGYLESIQNKQPKKRIIQRISIDLRKMAINSGMEIDEIFRNENGISYQLQSMDSAYKGYKIYVPATKLFEETVNLYRNNHDKYHEILKEARNMIDQSGNKEQFMDWASSTLTAQRCKWLEVNIQKVEQFAIASKLLDGSIFDTTDIAVLFDIRKALLKNKLFQLKNRKLFKNIMDDFGVYGVYCSQLSSHKKADAARGDDSHQDKEDSSSQSSISNVLKAHYQYGFRIDSLRELMRFRQFSEAMGFTVPDDDDKLKEAILAEGNLIDDKVYCKSDSLYDELKSLIEEIFANGSEVVYYESLLEKKAEWMATHAITSEEILKEYLQKSLPNCSFSKKLMLSGLKRTEKEAVTIEIKRVWGDGQTENVETLSERLPYIPLGNIWRVISGNDLFVLSNEGEYLSLDRFLITEDEKNAILAFVESSCEENGFASLSDVPLGDIMEQNYELSPIPIYNAIYKKVLMEKYYLNGKILTKDKPDLDTISLLKAYLSGKDECTFEEVANKVVELTGGTNRQCAFQALYDEMVRVDAGHYVANHYVNFDIDEIDKALSCFITDHFSAIRDVTTFAMFPVCGQNWNHYLLESFCYKYSRQYSLHTLNFNDKNAGIIAEKGCDKSYIEMLAIALARADLELTPENAGRYLFQTGYMAKSKYGRMDEIVQLAQSLREER